MASLLKQPTATPSQNESSIIFTSGSSIQIKAPASKVFNTILDTTTYQEWNTTNPEVTFQSSTNDQKFSSPNTMAELSFLMSPEAKPTKVPIKILDVKKDDTAGTYRLEWQGQLLPRWFGMAERVQTVRSLGTERCELVQWESMSGWGVWVLDWVMGVRKQMDAANVRYAEDLKRYAEGA